MESTASLFRQIHQGDEAALDRLFRRYLPILSNWASGRLPARIRDSIDTDDLVQVSLVRALNRIEEFEPRREGAFLCYLRTTLLNQIRDQVRRVDRRPAAAELPEDAVDPSLSPLERAIRTDELARYDEALQRLTEEQREAVVLRLELGLTYREMAESMESPSPDAARMLVTRGLVRLSELMAGRGAGE